MSAESKALPPIIGHQLNSDQQNPNRNRAPARDDSEQGEIHTAPSGRGPLGDQEPPSGPPDVDVLCARSVPPVIDVSDLDWATIRGVVNPAMIRARMRGIVESIEVSLDSVGGPGMLFDSDRQDASDRAIRVSAIPTTPLWFIGDLHGDLLALESTLALIASEAGHPPEHNPRIVFLGDLFDDEGFGLETLLRVFELIIKSPQSVCLIKGNHDEALSYDGVRFASTVEPAEFSEFLNANLAHEWIERTGKLAVRIFAQAPCALFFPDGLLVAHGGFPLLDLHPQLLSTGNWNDPACLSDFVWTRAHPTARKKLPNRYSRGSQFGYEDFEAFCSVSKALGRPITHMVRGHDHVENRYAIFPAYQKRPVLTTVALARRLRRERFGSYERVPTVARFVEGTTPQVYRLHIPASVIREVYPEADDLSDQDEETSE